MRITVGCDIEEVSRFKECSEAFLNKCFHKSEIDYCLKHKNYAQNLCGRFCAKEAFAKAVGRSQEWHEVEILNDEHGKPYINLYGKAKDNLQNAIIELSISHCKDYATATVIILYDSNS